MTPMEVLLDIVRRLRAPAGCPWDRAQTFASLRPYLLEEAYELAEAIDSGDSDRVRQEAGDLLFQVCLLSQIADDNEVFGFDEVARGIADKMQRRHPHVFDAQSPPRPEDGEHAAWEARKASERPRGTSALDGVPRAMPALLRAHRVSEKASTVGFDWRRLEDVRAKVDEELAELDEAIEAGRADAIEDELGDVLFALVNLGRHLPTTAEDALRRATQKFSTRFRRLESDAHAAGLDLHKLPDGELEKRWQQAKLDVE